MADGLTFLEGPRWHDGRLYVSDFYSRRVLTIDEQGRIVTVCEVAGQPSGLGFSQSGDLWIVSRLDRRILMWRSAGLEVVADLSAHSQFPLNDMLIDVHGRAYLGNLGFDAIGKAPVSSTHLIRLDPDGSVSIDSNNVTFPNGMALTPDQRRLLLAETYACRISSFDVCPDGTLSARSEWASFWAGQAHASIAEAVESRAILPDGIALDAEGLLWLSDANGHGAVRVAEGGRVVQRINTGDLAVYAVALGGREMRTLFMCAAAPLSRRDHQPRSAILLAYEVDVPSA